MAPGRSLATMADKAVGLELGEVKRRILIMLDPASTNEERKRAHAFYEAVRDNEDPNFKLERVGFELAKSGKVESLRYAGLTLVEHFVRYKWKSSEYDRIYDLQRAACSFWNDDIQKEGESRLVLVELSKVLVEVAKRQWPQYWETFISDIRKSHECGVCQLEVGVLTLGRLGEDLLMLEDTIGNRDRKKQLMAALRASIGEIADLFRDVLKLPHPRLLEMALHALCPFLSWMPVGHAFGGTPSSDLTDLLLQALSVPELRMPAAECLRTFAARKDSWSQETEMREKTILWYFSCFPQLRTIIESTNAALGTSEDAEEYKFLKSLNAITNEMGSNLLLQYWKSKGKVEVPQNFVLYLHVMHWWLVFESSVISTCAFDFWARLLDGYGSCPVIQQYLPELMTVFHTTLAKRELKYNDFDFNDTVESTSFVSIYKTHQLCMLQALIGVDPDMVYQHVVEWIGQLTTVPVVPLSGANEHTPPSSSTFLEWDALVAFLEEWTRFLMKHKEDPQCSLQIGSQVLQQLLTYQAHDACVLWYVLKSWTALHGFAIQNPKVLRLLISKLAEYVVFSLPGEAKHSFSKETRHVRQTALGCLTRVCSSFPKQLSQEKVTESLVKFYHDLLVGDSLRVSEVPGFVECIAVLGHCAPEDGEWQAVLKSVLGREEAVLEAANKEDAYLSGEAFVRYLHLDKEPTDAVYPEGKLRRAQLSAAVGSFTSVLKAYTSVKRSLLTDVELSEVIARREGYLFSNVKLLTEVALQLIRCLYETWQPGTSQHLSTALKNLSAEYHPFEVESIMGVSILHPELKERGEEVDHVRIGLSSLYEQCVMYIEHAMYCCSAELYQTPGAIQYITDTVFTEAMDPYRLKIALNVLLGAVQSCYPDHFREVACLLQRAFYLTVEVLDHRWSRVAGSNPVSTPSTSQNEVLFDRLTSLLSREYVRCLETCLLLMGTTKSGRSEVTMDDVEAVSAGGVAQADAQLADVGFGGLELTPLAESLWEQGHGLLLLQWTFPPLVWPDSQLGTRVAKLAACVYAKLLASGPTLPDTVHKLFAYTLEGVRVHGGKENCQVFGNLAYYVYITSLGNQLIKEELKSRATASNREIEQLDKKLKAKDKKVGKKYFKDLMQRIQEVSLSERYKMVSFIAKLPETQAVEMTGASSPLVTEDSSSFLGLAELFSRQ